MLTHKKLFQSTLILFVICIALFDVANAIKNLRRSNRNLDLNEETYQWLGEGDKLCVGSMHGHACMDDYVRCSGECSLCIDRGLVCLALSSTGLDVPAEYKDKAIFGKHCSNYPFEPTKKVLCGPQSEASGNYWIGTAPFCSGSKDDCEKNGDEYILEADEESDVPSEFLKDKLVFGKPCWSGDKVLCKITE